MVAPVSRHVPSAVAAWRSAISSACAVGSPLASRALAPVAYDLAMVGDDGAYGHLAGFPR